MGGGEEEMDGDHRGGGIRMNHGNVWLFHGDNFSRVLAMASAASCCVGRGGRGCPAGAAMVDYRGVAVVLRCCLC